jgi:hypothetical protein
MENAETSRNIKSESQNVGDVSLNRLENGEMSEQKMELDVAAAEGGFVDLHGEAGEQAVDGSAVFAGEGDFAMEAAAGQFPGRGS